MAKPYFTHEAHFTNPYQAEKGMTWKDWYNSEYNARPGYPDNDNNLIELYDDVVSYIPTGGDIRTVDGQGFVLADDVIQNHGDYLTGVI